MKKLVQDLCKKKGVSMNLAETEMGLAKGYISKLEGHNPNQKTLQKISDYFNVSVDYLTGKENSIEYSGQADLLISLRHDKELLKALEKYMRLSEKKKKHVIDTINVLCEV